MSQSIDTPFDSMPCPDCGSRRLIQETSQSEDLYVDENGDPSYEEPRGQSEILSIWCPKCDKKLWSKDE